MKTLFATLFLFVLFTSVCLAQTTQPPPALVVTAALSGTPPFSVGATTNLTLTLTNTLPPSQAILNVPTSVTYSIAGGVGTISNGSSTLVKATNDLASGITGAVTLPTTIFTVGALPTGVTYNTTTGVLSFVEASSLDGGVTETITVPVTFRVAIQ